MIFLLADLSSPIQPYLPIIPPWVYSMFKFFFWLILIVSCLYFAFRLFLKHKDKLLKPKPYIPEPIPTEVFSKNTFYKEIDGIRKKHIKDNTLRMGLHELSLKLKAHLQTYTGKPIDKMTSSEIYHSINKKLGMLFEELALLQFGKSEPTLTDYEKIFSKVPPVTKAFQKNWR